MTYTKRFKLKAIRSIDKTSMSEVARKYKIPKNTLSRWARRYRLFGKSSLQNKKPGAKERPIDPQVENMTLSLWKERKRSAYMMQIDLKKRGFVVSKRQMEKIYLKNRLNRPIHKLLSHLKRIRKFQ